MKSNESTVKEISLATVKSNPNNPRVIKDDKFAKLVNSIKEFPKMMELRPIVVNADMVVLGGNMRLKALKELGYKNIPSAWVKNAHDLTEAETRRFIIADNVGFGEHDWEVLKTEWNQAELSDWGLDIPEIPDFASIDVGTDGFTLPDGDKAPFQQMTFTLADEQAIEIQNAISDVKLTDEYKYMETAENENSNGNALSLIVQQWAEQKK